MIRHAVARLLLVATLPAAAYPVLAGSETVFVSAADIVKREAPEQGALARLVVTRTDGRSFVLEASPTCGSIEPGQALLLEADGPAPAPGATFRRIDSQRTCAVERVEAIRIVRVTPSQGLPAPVPTAPVSAGELRSALARALAILGYDPGPAGGEDGLADALGRYRADRWHDVRGKSLRFSFWALALEALIERPRDDEALAIATVLLDAGE